MLFDPQALLSLHTAESLYLLPNSPYFPGPQHLATTFLLWFLPFCKLPFHSVDDFFFLCRSYLVWCYFAFDFGVKSKKSFPRSMSRSSENSENCQKLRTGAQFLTSIFWVHTESYQMHQNLQANKQTAKCFTGLLFRVYKVQPLLT